MMKKILDVTCGSKTIWFNKHHSAVIYCAKRKEELTNLEMVNRKESAS